MSKHTLVFYNLVVKSVRVLDGYNVEIEERYRTSYANVHRLVHMNVAGIKMVFGQERDHRFKITGHDYNDDGKWDRVFFCRYPELRNGCNSYFYTSRGKRWEPCPVDEGKLKSFTEREMEYAIIKLNAAMRHINNEDHLYLTLKD